jgi:ubiquinone/menaquinone biosynthesis C-methylase UbiE
MFLSGLTTGTADLTHLQFPDNSIESLSCMHTLEHVGLGRYGDRLDPQSDLQAARELQRVLKPKGQLLMVLPLNRNPKVVFNAHRLYSYEQVISMFSGLKVKEFSAIFCNGPICKNIQPTEITSSPDEDTTGLFWFVKP